MCRKKERRKEGRKGRKKENKEERGERDVTLGRVLGDAERRGPPGGRKWHRKVKTKTKKGVQV